MVESERACYRATRSRGAYSVTVPLSSGVVAIDIRGTRFNGSVVVVLPGDESGEVMVGPSPFERRLTRALAGRGVGFSALQSVKPVGVQ